jgi:tetratricopeptide (TPR) repeat protein
VRFTFLAILIACAWVFPAAATCHLSPMDQRQLAYFSRAEEKGIGRRGYNRGLTLLGGGCYSEAIEAFSDAEAKLQAVPEPTPIQKDVLGFARAARALAQALQKAERGDRSAAIAQIFRSVIPGPESVVKREALLRLSTLLAPGAPEWAEIQDDLIILASRGDWKAQRALTDHLLTSGPPAVAVAQLEKRLRSTQEIETSLGLRILLADAYRRTGRLLEATILVAELDREVGEKVLDWELRLLYLKVGAELARGRSADGVAGARQDLEIFERLEREVQP